MARVGTGQHPWGGRGRVWSSQAPRVGLAAMAWGRGPHGVQEKAGRGKGRGRGRWQVGGQRSRIWPSVVPAACWPRLQVPPVLRPAYIEGFEDCIAQHSTAQHSTAQLSLAQHSTAWNSTAQLGTARHSTAQRGTGRGSMTWHIRYTAGAPGRH